jgi:hypothetical protein
MTQIMLDAAMLSKLLELRQPLELTDESGRVLAVVTPIPDPCQYELVEDTLSPEELARRRSEPDYSTAEVLAHLERI